MPVLKVNDCEINKPPTSRGAWGVWAPDGERFSEDDKGFFVGLHGVVAEDSREARKIAKTWKREKCPEDCACK